jgi:DNA-binding Lrp family transcriptional regulator
MKKVEDHKYFDILKINIILNYIKENPGITGTVIADIFGLSRQGVNNILRKLLKEGLIFSNGYGSSTKKGGKKPKLFKFNESLNKKFKRVSLKIDMYYNP